MRLAISEDNPFGHDRFGYLWETLRHASTASVHLDVGSYDGLVPARLLESGIVSSVTAADVIDVAANFRAHHGTPPAGLEFAALDGGRLPFGDETFDSASLLDVLEHVADQGTLLDELHRVLKPQGLLVVTVPRRHSLSFLDTGNWKFVFPTAHRWYYTQRYSEAEYVERYQDPANGLIGDIEIAKSWHEHFRPPHLAQLLRSHGFQPVHLDGAGLLARPLALLGYAVPGATRLLGPVARLDARAFESTHLFSASERMAAPHG